MVSFLFFLLNKSKPSDLIPPSLDLGPILTMKCLVRLLAGVQKAWASAVFRAATFLSLDETIWRSACNRQKASQTAHEVGKEVVAKLRRAQK